MTTNVDSNFQLYFSKRASHEKGCQSILMPIEDIETILYLFSVYFGLEALKKSSKKFNPIPLSIFVIFPAL